jgi:acyl-CoA reductase-like NAD-dependent aldehyde dehydrogenase
MTFTRPPWTPPQLEHDFVHATGGFRGSGLGRQQGVDGLLEFTETKHLNFDSSATLW